MRSFKLAFVFLLVLGVAATQFAGGVYAQEELVEMGLEDILYMEIPVVISATLSAQPLDLIPGSMTVITQEQIRSYGLRTLWDLYPIVPGFFVEMSDHGHWVASLRATQSFKVMVNGHPVNDSYFRYALSWDYFPLENVEQVEIIRGPGASIWGDDALVGVVNIITKKDKETSISLTGGEWEHFSANLFHASDPDKDFSYSLQYDYMDENGDTYYYAEDVLSRLGYYSIVPTRNNRDKTMEGGALTLKYKDLKFRMEHRQYKIKAADGYVGSQSDDQGYFMERQTYADLEYTRALSDISSLYFRASYDQDYMNFKMQTVPYGFSFFGPASNLNADGYVDYWPNGNLRDRDFLAEKYTFEARYNTQVFTDHDIILGFHYRRDQIIDVRERTSMDRYLWRIEDRWYTKDDGYRTSGLGGGDVSTVSPCWLRADGHSEDIYALYFQDIWEVNHKLTCVLGTRWNDYDLAGSKMTPRIALIWQDLFGLGQILKFSYSEAFTAPRNYTRYRVSSGSWDENNVNLAHETSSTYELNLQNSYSEKLHYSLTYYEALLNNMVESYGLAYTNTGRNSMRGGEVELTWIAIEQLLNLWTNYSHCIQFNELTNQRIDDFRHWGNAGLTLALGQDLNFSYYAHFQGPHSAQEVKSWATGNVAIVYTGIPNTDISLTIHNLFDKNYRYPDAGSFGAPPSVGPGMQPLFRVTHRF